MKKEIVVNGNGNQVEYGTTSLDAFFEGTVSALPRKGKHVVKLLDWEMVPEKTTQTKTELRVQKPYVLLTHKAVRGGELIESRLYSGFVPYFMAQLNSQYEGEASGLTLSQLLAKMQKCSYELWVDYSGKNGIQISYREP